MRTDGSNVTIVGRAANDAVLSTTDHGDRTSLRVLSTERRFDDTTKTWIDGDEFGVNVVCWRQLAAGVVQHIRKGDPVIVTGRISTRKFERDGKQEYFTEVKADFVGIDVSRAGQRIKRVSFVERAAEARAAAGAVADPYAAPDQSPSGVADDLDPADFAEDEVPSPV